MISRYLCGADFPLRDAEGDVGAATLVIGGDATQQCIEEALRASGGKIYGPDGAAATLGLKPTTLQSKMQKLGLLRRTVDSSKPGRQGE